tara:strand:+ start:3167 stop:4432 length:1266 start_codon:yes stop_codon:yes gene_type:complete
MRLGTVIKIILGLYLVSLFAPNTSPLLDLNTWRSLSFSIVNSVSLFVILSYDELRNILKKVIKSKTSIAGIIFTLWALLSYFYAINPTEVIVRSSLFVNFFLLYLCLSVFLKHESYKKIHITLFITILLLVQVSFSYSSYFQVLEYREYNFELNNLLIGLFSNRNVTSAVYLLQVPFVIYTIINSKSQIIKNLSFFILTLTLYMVFLLASRTAYVILLSLLIFYLLHLIINKFKSFKLFKSGFSILLFSLFISYSITLFSIGSENSSNAVKRIQSIDFAETSTNTRLRYYSHSIDQFFSNPLIGVGYGNWKIESINRDKNNIISYVVPYTMHNDFLEVLVELGLIGLLLYLFIYLFPFFKFRKVIFENNSTMFALFLSSSLIVFIVDSNINFPAIRMSTLFYLALILSLFHINKNSLNEDN